MDFINQRQIFFGSGKATGRHDGRLLMARKNSTFSKASEDPEET